MNEAETFEVTSASLDAGQVVVRVRGELDLATCPELENALAQAPTAARIVLDLTQCSFLDSSAIRVVLKGASRVESDGGGILLVASDPRVLRVLEIADVGARVPIHPTVEAATADRD